MTAGRSVLIGIPTLWRAKETTDKLLARLESEMRPDDQLLVMDNASGAYKDWTLTQMWNEATTQAVRSESHALLLNDDIEIISPGNFLDAMRAGCEAAFDLDVGVVSPNWDGRVVTGSTLRAASGHRVEIREDPSRIALPTDLPGMGAWCGFAFALPNRGDSDGSSMLIPEELRWGYGDNWLGNQVTLLGQRAMVLLDVHIAHAWHTTTREVLDEGALAQDAAVFRRLAGDDEADALIYEGRLSELRRQNRDRLQAMADEGARIQMDGLQIVLYTLLDRLLPEGSLERLEFDIEVEVAVGKALEESEARYVRIDKPRGITRPQHLVWGKEES